MCGIIGIVGCEENLGKVLLQGIKRLEYRGYDSVGMAALHNGVVQIKKDVGEVDVVDAKVDFRAMIGTLGVAHSRWGTHGGITKENAHPHQSCDGKITIVHNGIIENFEEMKKDLLSRSHKFKSETDSEVIAHYFEEELKRSLMNDAIVNFLKIANGTFATLIIKNDEERIYALKRDSPMVLGLHDKFNILASDIYAFSDITNKAIFFDNDEFAIISSDKYIFFDKKGCEIKKEITEFDWEQEESEKKEYAHYMIKEIMEEPLVVKRLLKSLQTDQKERFEQLVAMVKQQRKIVFVAAGTSYHASLLGAYFLHKCGVEAQTLIASEFKNFAFIDNKSLVIAISQSGETMDVIEALKYSKSCGAKIASLVNVPYSTIQRMSNVSLNILAGQEICVASTKSFVNQATLLLRLSQEFGFAINLNNLAERIQEMLDQADAIRKISDTIYDKHDLYVLGRGLSYPVAREVALKIKEISYIHAEGMMGGELKHGTIALIEQDTPVISLISGKDYDMVSNTKEVEARGAKTIIVSNELPGNIKINSDNDGKFGILASIFGQLLAYYLALNKGLPIDKPRNLAKSVTVK